MDVTRRQFITSAALASMALRLEAQQTANPAPGQAPPTTTSGKGFGSSKPPILVSSANGWNGIDHGYQMVKSGQDTLDAAIAVGKVQEDDPNDNSVGYGGLPNEEGVVELDSSCMHGPTRRAGSVGGVRNIKNVSLVAQAVMRHTGHVMLVGEGAERFAVAQGFPRENLLTEHSRKIWLLWKEYHSTDDWRGPGLADPQWKPPQSSPQAELWQKRLHSLFEIASSVGLAPDQRPLATRKVLFPPTGTIHCSALNDKGEISGCTTTSGLAYKLPGRVGDSPLIGAGCYTDQDVGSAGATGSGEEKIKVAGAHTIVENMRRGMSPQEAGTDALKRIVRNYDNDMNRLRFMDMTYYVLRKDGAYAGVSLWEGYAPSPWEDPQPRPHRIAVHDGSKRSEKTVALFKGYSQEFPPFPKVPDELLAPLRPR